MRDISQLPYWQEQFPHWKVLQEDEGIILLIGIPSIQKRMKQVLIDTNYSLRYFCDQKCPFFILINNKYSYFCVKYCKTEDILWKEIEKRKLTDLWWYDTGSTLKSQDVQEVQHLNSSLFCNCSSPVLVQRVAGLEIGNIYQYCTQCKKERR